MAGYWITECISIYVTAMLPLLMGPLMGIISSKAACSAYIRVSVLLVVWFFDFCHVTTLPHLLGRHHAFPPRCFPGCRRWASQYPSSYRCSRSSSHGFRSQTVSIFLELHNIILLLVLITVAFIFSLLLGLMIPTWFLSMWMSNAAATIMMLTIVEALMSRLESIKSSE